MSPIRLAMIGAGLFARDAHVPAILSHDDLFHITAVCSRTEESARKLADLLPYSTEVLTDVDALLARDDIDAVDVVMPIETMPDIVEKALRSGKHVISEKPIAPDVATGKALLAVPRAAGQVWMLAENWRYEEAHSTAAKAIADGIIGKPITCSWSLFIDMSPSNKYYSTEWRRTGTFPGGFLLDGGVHHVAALRMILGEIESVAAYTAQMRPDLPPAETLSAALRFESGVIGSYTVTYAAGSAFPQPLVIVGEKGSLKLDRSEVEIAVDGERTRHTFTYKGVDAELAAFAAAIQQGEPHLNTPEAGLQDVAVAEAMLQSAETGQRIQPERFV
jgi:predicted dehydrogenase